MMRYLKYAIGLLAVLYLLTGVTQIRPGELAVVRRFGKVVAEWGPGLHVGLPWGMDRVDRVPVDLVRRVSVGYQAGLEETDPIIPAGQLLTGDHNLVNVQIVVDYAIRSSEVVDYVVQQERVDGIVARLTESLLAEWVAGRTVDDVLIHGKVELPRFLIEHAQRRLEPYALGIDVQAASVAYLLPPDDVKSAFEDVTRAQTGIATSENAARKDAHQTQQRAAKEKFKIEQQTAHYARDRVELARAEADSFTKRVKQYQELRQKNSDILATIWWDEMGKLLRRLKENGRIDLLDNHLGPDGLDITIMGPQPRKK